MSFIIEALNKTEQERKPDDTTGFDGLNQPLEKAPTTHTQVKLSKIHGYGILVAVMLTMVLFYGLFSIIWSKNPDATPFMTPVGEVKQDSTVNTSPRDLKQTSHSIADFNSPLKFRAVSDPKPVQSLP